MAPPMHHVSRRPFLLSPRAMLSWQRCSRHMSLSSRTYNDAIDALNTLQTPYDVIEARRKTGIRPDGSSVLEMGNYLQRIGYSPEDLNRLNVIHVAGTKGKGSTCAFVDSILSQYRHPNPSSSGSGSSSKSLTKTGLFLSPHLIAVRERIRINSAPLPKALFAQYFFDVWDRLRAGNVPLGGRDDAEPWSRPAYSRYLTLMSWHVFLQEGVDAVVYETGIGGEYDATNLVQRPLASGITTLGIDHVFALGDTVDKIAWHKAGIMKTGSPAFTIEQLPEAEAVLKQRAKEKGVDLQVLPIDPRLSAVKVSPDADFQKKNVTLAISLAETALTKLGVLESSNSSLPEEFVKGIEGTVFRGRCEVKHEDKVLWHVDGAHTADSLKVSARWFAEETAGRTGPRVMIFNQQGRDEAIDFLPSIRDATKRDGSKPAFDHVIFCTNVTRPTTGYERDFVNHQHDPEEIKSMATQHRFAEKWSQLDPNAKVLVIPTIEEAITYARDLGHGLTTSDEHVQALITGSLHLVGGALGILEEADAL